MIMQSPGMVTVPTLLPVTTLPNNCRLLELVAGFIRVLIMQSLGIVTLLAFSTSLVAMLARLSKKPATQPTSSIRWHPRRPVQAGPRGHSAGPRAAVAS